MERESFKSTEQALNIPFDAILIHGYWMSEPRKDDVRLALRSRLAVRAGVLAYNEGKGAKKIVIDLGHLWGPSYPTEGQLMADELQTKYDIPSEAIVLKEDAYSTGGEVKSFVELARQNGWTKLMDISFAKHHRTISRIYNESNTDADFKSVEEIIEEKDINPHVKNLVKRLRRSKYELTYAFYETAKWIFMHRPGFDYNVLEQKNKLARTDKGKEFILPIDVYKL